MTKYIFVTGGVLSSLGKGITAASIGTLLKHSGKNVGMLKIDPYINVDPGTMSPLEHGEVFVTKDGAETDLDIGNYERFLDTSFLKTSNFTTGQVYSSVIERERAGGYLGQTIQVIPHIVGEIVNRIKQAGEGHDILVVELGGTVGDIEGLPFMEAIRQMKHDDEVAGTFFIHVTLIPFIKAAGELKSKPTQHSVQELRRIGITPQMIIARSENPLPKSFKKKLAMGCDVNADSVIEATDVSTVLLETFFSAILIIGLLFVVGKRLMNWLLHFSASSEVDELFMGSVLFIVMSASLFAYYMGFTYSLGAFLAGMIIAETKYHHKVEADIAPFKDILLGTFFVIVGMKINIAMFLDNVLLVIAMFLFVLFVKTTIIFITLRLSNPMAVSLKTALSLSQIGEFSFVIFAVATSGGIIDEKLASLLVLIVILSMMVTPFFIPKINDFVENLVKEKEVKKEDMSALKGIADHVVVCGYSVVGKFVAQHLEAIGVHYIVVDNSNKHVQEALNDGIEAYLGDVSKSAIIEALHVDTAAAVIVTLDNLDKKRVICEAILKEANNANVIVKVTSLEEKEKLEDLDITTMVDGKVEVARVLVERMMSCQLRYT